MKRRIKKSFAILLAFCMAISLLPTVALAVPSADTGVTPAIPDDLPYLTALSLEKVENYGEYNESYVPLDLSTDFNQYVTDYTVHVPYDTEYVRVRSTDESSYETIGVAQPLSLGYNLFCAQATDPGSGAVLNYWIEVYRDNQNSGTSVADLTAFSISSLYNNLDDTPGYHERTASISSDGEITLEFEDGDSFSHDAVNAVYNFTPLTAVDTSVTLNYVTLTSGSSPAYAAPNNQILTVTSGTGVNTVTKNYVIKCTWKANSDSEETWSSFSNENYDLRYDVCNEADSYLGIDGDGVYVAGDMIYFDVYARTSDIYGIGANQAHAADIGSYQFTATFDSTYLTYNGATSNSSTFFYEGDPAVSSVNTGEVKVSFTATNAIPVHLYYDASTGYSGYVKLCRLGFTVKSDIPESITALTASNFTIKESFENNGVLYDPLEVTPDGYDGNAGFINSVYSSETASVGNSIATFNNNHTTNITDGTKAYIEYGQAGLYTDNTYVTAFTLPTPLPDTGYRLAADTEAEPLWHVVKASDSTLIGNYTSTNLPAAVLVGASNTDNVIITPNTYWQVVVTFAAGTGGSVSSSGPLSYDGGMKLTDKTMPTPSANDGYSFIGWSATASASALLNLAEYTVPNDGTTGTLTVTAMFEANTYSWVAPSLENASITTDTLTGVDGSSVTYGQDITFKLTPAAGYVIRADGVHYTIGEGNQVLLTPDAEGLYTIPGSVILDDVQLIVSATQYVTVTFQAGTGNTMTGDTAYAVYNVAGLYDSLADLVAGTANTFTVPTPTASEGYRLRTNTAGGEELWTAGGDPEALYTSTAVPTTAFTADTTLTARSVQTWDVTFARDANGTLDGEDVVNHTVVITVDTGYALISTDIPSALPNAGYAFDKWTWNSGANSAATLVGETITADITYTATFKDAVYAIGFSGGSAATFTPGTGVDGTEGAYTVTHGTAATFTMTEQSGYRVTAVKYKVGSGDFTTLTAVEGVYTIPGANITGDITVSVDAVNTYTVSFVAAAENPHGSVNAPSSFVVDNETCLSSTDFESVTTTPDTGYVFDHWVNSLGTPVSEVDITTATVTANVSYTAVFVLSDRTVTDADNIVASYTGLDGNNKAHYGTDVTITPITTNVVNSVSYSVWDPAANAGVGGWGAAIPITAEADGTYIIPGTAITNNIQITGTTLNTGSEPAITMEFISRADYKVVVNETLGKKILVLKGGYWFDKYQLKDGTELYWSTRYNAHVCWVADTATAVSLAAGMVRTTGTEVVPTSTSISYNGDINGSGHVTAADAGIISDCLHNQRIVPTSAMQLFKLDVEGTEDIYHPTEDGYKEVTTADILAVLGTSVT